MTDEQLIEYQQAMNSYVVQYGDMFAKGLYKQGIIKDVTPEQLQKYFSNPDFYQDIIDDIANYFYIINAEIHQLFELIEASPRLDYTLKTFTKYKDTEKNYQLIKRNLHKIGHKRLTRDLLKQNTSYGNVVGIWLGEGNELYPFIFNDLKYIVSPYRTVGAKWQVHLDMAFFSDMCEFERNEMLKQFSPHITKKDYEDYIEHVNTKPKPLPIDRTFLLNTGRLKRNQFNGTSWITPSMFDIMHKRKLKDVEQTIANKIINAVAVLTIGSFDGKESSNGDNLSRDYNKIPDKLVKSIHANVKAALSEGSKAGMALVSIPNFAKLEFNDPDSDALDGDKFNQTNSDIRSGLGLSGTAMNGEGANYNSAKLNFDIFFSKLVVLLEDIETEVYQRFIDLTLPKQKGNFYMEYCKDRPLTLTEKLKEMKGLNDKGWSSRHYIEAIGLDFDSVYEQTKFEVESGLYDMLQPPKTSHTTSNDLSGHGRPSVSDENASDETIRNRETQG